MMTRQRRALNAVIAASLAAPLLAACDPTPPAPPSTTPVTTASPTTSPTPTQTTEQADYTAAAEAYRNADRLVTEAAMAGTGTIPPEVAQYAVKDGRYWLTEAATIKSWADQGLRFDGPGEIVAILPIGTYEPSRLSMYVCADARDVTAILEDGTRKKLGILGAARLTFVKRDGRWLVDGFVRDADGRELNMQEVAKCEENPE